MAKNSRLELTRIGKDDRPRLEPRILIEEPNRSHHAATRREGDVVDNMLIHGDNLLALKALEADFAGKVKRICIDPIGCSPGYELRNSLSAPPQSRLPRRRRRGLVTPLTNV